MARLPSLPHRRVVRALEKAGFRVLREGNHVVMTDGKGIVTGILRDAGISAEQFRKLC